MNQNGAHDYIILKVQDDNLGPPKQRITLILSKNMLFG